MFESIMLWTAIEKKNEQKNENEENTIAIKNPANNMNIECDAFFHRLKYVCLVLVHRSYYCYTNIHSMQNHHLLAVTAIFFAIFYARRLFLENANAYDDGVATK